MKHEELLSKLIGMPVSHVWFSDYAVVFFELGVLTPSEMRRRDGSQLNPDGQISIYTGFDWRIEKPKSVFCSRNCSRRRRVSVCESLLGTTVTEASITGRIPELNLGFSNGLWLMTFELSRGDPMWCVSFKESDIWLSTKRGRLAIENGTGQRIG